MHFTFQEAQPGDDDVLTPRLRTPDYLVSVGPVQTRCSCSRLEAGYGCQQPCCVIGDIGLPDYVLCHCYTVPWCKSAVALLKAMLTSNAQAGEGPLGPRSNGYPRLQPAQAVPVSDSVHCIHACDPAPETWAQQSSLRRGGSPLSLPYVSGHVQSRAVNRI